MHSELNEPRSLKWITRNLAGQAQHIPSQWDSETDTESQNRFAARAVPEVLFDGNLSLLILIGGMWVFIFWFPDQDWGSYLQPGEKLSVERLSLYLIWINLPFLFRLW